MHPGGAAICARHVKVLELGLIIGLRFITWLGVISHASPLMLESASHVLRTLLR